MVADARRKKARRDRNLGTASTARLAVRPPIRALLADLPALDPGAYPDRDSLIRDLAGRFAWPAEVVGPCFDLTARQVRRIAGPLTMPGEAPGLPTRETPALTMEEARTMLNDYFRDPYTSPAEREEARAWIESQDLAPA